MRILGNKYNSTYFFFLSAGTASTIITPAKMSAEAMKMRQVIGSPMKTTPSRLPKMPEVESSIATCVGLVNFCAAVWRTSVSAQPIVPRKSRRATPRVRFPRARARRQAHRGRSISSCPRPANRRGRRRPRPRRTFQRAGCSP